MPFADLFGPVVYPELNPFDFDAVEVLKGPQGTLFGSGSFAGAIRYIVHKPDHAAVGSQGKRDRGETSRGGGISPVMAGSFNVPCSAMRWRSASSACRGGPRACTT